MVAAAEAMAEVGHQSMRDLAGHERSTIIAKRTCSVQYPEP
jgi:hypothetical protein